VLIICSSELGCTLIARRGLFLLCEKCANTVLLAKVGFRWVSLAKQQRSALHFRVNFKAN
jgi:hypothetical protein